MKKPKMKPCWHQMGLTKKGAELADRAIEPMTVLANKYGVDLLRNVLREIEFRIDELPKRSEDFQRRYRKENGA